MRTEIFLLSLRPFVAPRLPMTNVQSKLTSLSPTNPLLSLIMLIDLSLFPSTSYCQWRPSRIINILKGWKRLPAFGTVILPPISGYSRWQQKTDVVYKKRWAETRSQGRRNKNWGTEKNKTRSILKALIMNEVAFVRWLDLPFYLYCFNEVMMLPILFIFHALAMTLKFYWWGERQSGPVHFAVYKKWCAVYQASIYLY